MPTKPLVFKFNGKEQFDPKTIATPGIDKVLKIIDGADLGAVFLADHIAARIEINADSFSRKFSQDLQKRGYALKYGQKRYYGKPETMKALKNELDR
jgi:hypothetical protein